MLLRRPGLFLITLALVAGCEDKRAGPKRSYEIYVSKTNAGKALFETRKFDAALNSFEAARDAHPDESAATFNIALTLMNIRGREPEALVHLREAVKTDRDSAATHYLIGLCLANAGPTGLEERIRALERSIELEPDIPNVRWQLGAAYLDAGRHQAAYEQFRECVRLDPLHDKGFYSLRGAAQALGKRDEALRAVQMMVKIQKFRGGDPRPPDELTRCRHTRVRTPFPPASPLPGIDVTFMDATESAGLAKASESVAPRVPGMIGVASVIDLDDDGRWDIIVSGPDGRPHLFRNSGNGRFELQSSATPDIPPAHACVVADFGNDGRDDLFFTGPSGSHWLRRVRLAHIQDAIPGSLAASGGAASVAGGLVVAADFDGDGRPDLLATDATGRGRILRNAGPARFVDVTDSWQLPTHGPVSACLAADLDGDRRPDLVLAAPDGLHVLINAGGNAFRSDPTREEALAVSASSVTAVDIDADGDLDLLLAAADARPHILRNNGRARFTEASTQAGLPRTVPDLRQVLAFDVSGDGVLDLILLTESESPGAMSKSTVLIGRTDGTFTPPSASDRPPHVSSGRAAFVKTGADGRPVAFFRAGRLGGALRDTGASQPRHPDLGGLIARAVVIVDLDDDGRDDLLLVGGALAADGHVRPRPPKLLRNLGDANWQDVTHLYGLDAVGSVEGRSIAVADFDGDGDQDCVFGVAGAAPIYVEYDAEDRLIDVAPRAGLAGVRGRDALPLDYDVDGDLDLVVARHAGGLGLWRNNGDGTFTDAFAGKPDVRRSDTIFARLAVLDLRANDAPDIVAAGLDGTSPLLNQREGTFAPPTPPAERWPGASTAAVDDFNNDGYADLALARPGRITIRSGGDQAPTTLETPGTRPSDLLPFDFDNDGWTDLLIASAAAEVGDDNESPSTAIPLQLWRNAGPVGWENVSDRTGISRIAVDARRAAAADLDNDGDTDVLLATADRGPVLLRNDGGNAHRQLKVRLIGTKTNRNGIGVHIEARIGEFRANRVVTRPVIEIGVGPHARLDSLRTAWTNGILEHDIGPAVDPAKPLSVTEPKVAAGSCPYLYAWTGRGFAFVTDLLGGAPAGLSYARGKYLPADPTEFVRIGDVRDFPPRDGRFVLQATNELREVFYLDQAGLAVVDHPADVEPHSNDKLRFPPFDPSRIVPLRNMRLPTRAVDGRGQDCTDAVRAIDRVYTDPGRSRLLQLRGWVPPHSLTLQFGKIESTASNVLGLTGWLQYGDASANIALSQSPEAVIIPPRLEASGPDGVWRPVDVVVGMPAGKTKTIVVDLAGKLPPGTAALRLTTTFEIRWDRIALFERAADAAMKTTTLDAETADLHFHGFGRIYPHVPNGPYTPDYDDPAPRPTWRIGIRGWYTRYGDVRELLTAADNRYAILNGGDEVTLTFDAAALPPLPDGWVRELFFYSVGWDKDMDHNIRAGQTVTPLPYLGMDDQTYGATDAPTPPELAPWDAEYNTRYVPADRFFNR